MRSCLGVPEDMQYNHLKYTIMEFDTFRVQEVLKQNAPSGEYHFCLTKKIKQKDFLSIIQKALDGEDVGTVDSDGFLGLEYPIYALVKNNISLLNILDIFHSIDDQLKEILNAAK